MSAHQKTHLDDRVTSPADGAVTHPLIPPGNSSLDRQNDAATVTRLNGHISSSPEYTTVENTKKFEKLPRTVPQEGSPNKASLGLSSLSLPSGLNAVDEKSYSQKLKSSVSFDNHQLRRRIYFEEVAPSMSTLFDDPGDWKLSLDIFTSKKHGKPDKKLPKSVRHYYKEQDELIAAFEDMHLEVEDATASAEEQQKQMRLAAILAKVTFFVNLILLVAKGVAAGLTGSLSVISAVIDSGVDLLSGVLIWWSNRAVRKRNPYEYPQGRTKIEPIAIVILSVVMSLASVQMIRESIEKIIHYATDDDTGPVFEIPAIVICTSTVVVKFVLWMLCRRVKNPSVQALAQDQRNDVLSNTIALAGGFIGYRYWSYADPIGAFIISVYIIVSWFITGWEQIKLLTGHTAQPEFLKKLTWICLNHHPKVQHIDTVRAFHFGNNFLVEVDIVLPEKTILKEAHDIGEALQQKLERLVEVERAFVHLDYEFMHNPNTEHKVV